MKRRSFLQAVAGGSLGTLAALRQPSTALAADTAQPILLGFDSYSLRAFHWKSMQLLDYTASLKLDAIQISDIDDFESLDPSHLAKVKARAEQLGIKVDGGIGSICPTSTSYNRKNGEPADYLLLGLRTSKAVGAPAMRCFLGGRAERTSGKPIEEHMESTIKVFRSVRSQATDLGVKIALENHNGDLQASDLKTIIEESGKEFVGACLDSGNPMWLVEDPLFTLETLAPYVVTTHIRDSAVYETARGAAFQWVALGDGNIDLAMFIKRYRELCPKASMQLEIITGRPPAELPYLEPAFWKAFPKKPATEFARFVAIAKKGRPFSGYMVIADGIKQIPDEYKEALKIQQRRDLERSFEYAKKTLDVGVRWRTA